MVEPYAVQFNDQQETLLYRQTSNQTEETVKVSKVTRTWSASTIAPSDDDGSTRRDDSIDIIDSDDFDVSRDTAAATSQGFDNEPVKTPDGTQQEDIGWSLPGCVASPRTDSILPSPAKWDDPTQTLVLLDWDDTLCPTTSCNHFLDSCRPSGAELDLLKTHSVAVVNFLRRASELSHVVIITMAEAWWVKHCITMIMPEVGDVLKELEIEVISAKDSTTQRSRRIACCDDRNPSQFFKTKAMERVIKEFYKPKEVPPGERRRRVWKNVLSIGDSTAERLALQDLAFRRIQRSSDGEWQECRCKTLLLVSDPTLEQLTLEVEQLPKLLTELVHHDGDVHSDVKASDLELPLSNHQAVQRQLFGY